MARKKAVANYDKLLIERKQYTENVVKCTIETYEDFAAVFAANCWWKNIPESVICSFMQKEINQPGLNTKIATIIQRTYAKRESEKSSSPSKNSVINSKPAPIKENIKESKLDIKDGLAKGLGDPQFASQEVTKIFMERLPNFNYNNAFIAKLLALYSTIKPTGRLSEISRVGKSLGVSASETDELIANFKRLGVLTIEDNVFKKSIPVNLFTSPTE